MTAPKMERSAGAPRYVHVAVMRAPRIQVAGGPLLVVGSLAADLDRGTPRFAAVLRDVDPDANAECRTAKATAATCAPRVRPMTARPVLCPTIARRPSSIASTSAVATAIRFGPSVMASAGAWRRTARVSSHQHCQHHGHLVEARLRSLVAPEPCMARFLGRIVPLLRCRFLRQISENPPGLVPIDGNSVAHKARVCPRRASGSTRHIAC